MNVESPEAIRSSAAQPTDRDLHHADAISGELRIEPNARADIDPEFDGLELEAWAASAGMTVATVWGMLRRGELLGRTEKGKIHVYSRTPAAEARATRGADNLPPLPGEHAGQDATASAMATGHEAARAGGTAVPQAPWGLTTVSERSPEMALLLDHLSLAKEENREILKLTQDSLQRISSMTDTIVAMKDLLLKTKQEQLDQVQEVLNVRTADVRRLRQDNSDLETMVRTLAAELAQIRNKMPR